MTKLFFAIPAGLIVTAAPGIAQDYSYGQPQQQQQAPSRMQSQSPSKDEDAKQDSNQKNQAKPSSKAMKAIIALNNAAKANDSAAFAQALPEAKAKASTNEDRYLIGQLQLKMALAANDNAGIDSAIDEIAASNFLAPKEVAILYEGQGGSYYTAKNYEGAVRAFDRGLAIDPGNTQLMINLAESRFAQGRGADAVAALQKVMAAGGPSGKAQEAVYKRAVGIAYSSKLPVAGELSRKWVEAYPGSESWHNALAIYQNSNKLDPSTAIGLYRLMAATNALTTSDDYYLYSATAFELGNYVESQAIIDAGIAAGKIKTTSPLIKDVVEALASKPKTSAADLAEAARTAKDAKAKIRVADRYLGMGDYAKALELYRQADGAAGVDSNLLKLNIGIALARTGDKAGAQAAFAGVSGALQPIAAYWQLYVKQMA